MSATHEQGVECFFDPDGRMQLKDATNEKAWITTDSPQEIKQ